MVIGLVATAAALAIGTSPAVAQLPASLPEDGAIVSICARSGLPLEATAEGVVVVGESAGDNSSWLVARDSNGGFRFKNLGIGRWLNNAAVPHQGVDLVVGNTGQGSLWDVDPSNSLGLTISNQSVSADNTALSLLQENPGRAVELGGENYQGAFWSMVPVDGGARCRDDGPPVAVDDTAAIAVGQSVFMSLVDNDQPTFRDQRFYLPLELDSGQLPPGLRLAQGALQGAPTQAGVFTFGYRLPAHGAFDTATVTVEVTDGTFTTIARDDAATVPVGVRHEIDLTENDDIAGLSSSAGIVVSSGEIPPGMRLVFSGFLVGRPETPGTFTFGYHVTSIDGTGDLATATITITGETPTEAADDAVFGQDGQWISESLITNDTLSGALARVEVVSGTVPPGVTLSSRGNIEGTPTESGDYLITYRLVSTSGSTDTAEAKFNIARSSGATVANDDFYEVDAGLDLRIEPLDNDTFSARLDSFEILSGEVPGMQVGGELGPSVIGGQPVEAGVFELVYRITSTSGSTDTGTIRVVVNKTDPVVIEDTLTTVDGDPIADLELVLVRRTGIFRAQREFARATTDQNGHFRFEAIQGRYNLYFPAMDDAVYVLADGDSVWPAPQRHDVFLLAEPGDVFDNLGVKIGKTSASISGDVTGAGPDSPLTIDLYSVAPSGERDQWQGTIFREADGPYQLALVPGQWVITFGVGFDRVLPNGSRYLHLPVSLDPGQELTGIHITVGVEETQATVSGRVTDDNNQPIEGVVVDRFMVADDGTTNSWLGEVRTGRDGRFQSMERPGCYRYVFIAPTGRIFANGGRFTEWSGCLSSKQMVDNVDAQISAKPDAATIGGMVDDQSKRPVSGVVVDLFAVGGDGTRTTWLGDTTTDTSGRYRFETNPGCVAVVIIAPTGFSFGGTRYHEVSRCLDAGSVADTINTTISG